MKIIFYRIKNSIKPTGFMLFLIMLNKVKKECSMPKSRMLLKQKMMERSVMKSFILIVRKRKTSELKHLSNYGKN